MTTSSKQASKLRKKHKDSLKKKLENVTKDISNIEIKFDLEDLHSRFKEYKLFQKHKYQKHDLPSKELTDGYNMYQKYTYSLKKLTELNDKLKQKGDQNTESIQKVTSKSLSKTPSSSNKNNSSSNEKDTVSVNEFFVVEDNTNILPTDDTPSERISDNVGSQNEFVDDIGSHPSDDDDSVGMEVYNATFTCENCQRRKIEVWSVEKNHAFFHSTFILEMKYPLVWCAYSELMRV